MSEKRRTFSERMGARSVEPLGMEDMPYELRVSLWNVIEPWIWETRTSAEYQRRAQWIYNFHVLRWPTDEVPGHGLRHEATQRLKEWMLASAEWHEVYDFVEALPEMVASGLAIPLENLDRLARTVPEVNKALSAINRYSSNLNAMLEREGAPYRYRNLTLVPITSEDELAEVTRAMAAPFDGARMHMTNAVGKLSQRPTPDYRNCIKEAVSAVESLLQEATGEKGERLPKLLDAFEQKYNVDLHRAFKAALGSLYGWTSDDGGIRHGIFGTETVGHDEAQFMLIACSALVNFLVAKAGRET